MRNVNRSYLLADAPDSLSRLTTINECTTIANSGNANLIRRTIYADPYESADEDDLPQSRVIDKLNNWYYGKCAYCERFYKLDVEHYRPKGEIRGEDNELIRNSGYYWLGYEWSNLLPACISCNREGGKTSKFPHLAGGTIVTAPTFDGNGNLDRSFCIVNHNSLINELPALLNPETDANIHSYFEFEIDAQQQGIKIIGVDNQRRGEITIKICKLNRPEIRRDRLQSVVKDFVNCISIVISKYSNTNDIDIFQNDVDLLLQKLYNDANDPLLSHTMLRKFIVSSNDNFKNIIIPFVVEEFKQLLLLRFQNYTPI